MLLSFSRSTSSTATRQSWRSLAPLRIGHLHHDPNRRDMFGIFPKQNDLLVRAKLLSVNVKGTKAIGSEIGPAKFSMFSIETFALRPA